MRKRKTVISRFLSAIMIFSLIFSMVSVQTIYAQTADAKSSAETAAVAAKKSVTKQKLSVILTPGMKQTLYFNGSGKVKITNSNKSAVSFTKQSDTTYLMTAKKTGKSIIILKTSTAYVRIVINVKPKSTFEQVWINNWIKTYISEDTSTYDKLLYASLFLTTGYSYSNTPSSSRDVIIQGAGNCYTAGLLLVKMLKAMGFDDVQLRFAANDDMSRYPSGVTFGSQHYNVRVKIKGKNYYLDATPGSFFVYLSNDKKPLYYAMLIGGQLLVGVDKIH